MKSLRQSVIQIQIRTELTPWRQTTQESAIPCLWSLWQWKSSWRWNFQTFKTPTSPPPCLRISWCWPAMTVKETTACSSFPPAATGCHLESLFTWPMACQSFQRRSKYPNQVLGFGCLQISMLLLEVILLGISSLWADCWTWQDGTQGKKSVGWLGQASRRSSCSPSISRSKSSKKKDSWISEQMGSWCTKNLTREMTLW